MPFAAIYIPDFPVEAIVRAEPELRQQAVAVVEGAPPLAHVIAVSESAAQAGVEPGMTKLQAEERLVDGRRSTVGGQEKPKSATTGASPTLSRPKEGRDKGGATSYIRQRSAEREAAAHAALLDCACGFSPRVEDTAADTVVLDLAGLERIFGPPAKMARDIARRCSELGLEANVAAASTVDTAVLAARGFAGVTVIAEGKEAERLGELGELGVEILVDSKWSAASSQWPAKPAALDPGACATRALEVLETLERWGVRNLRALAALPEVAVTERLGQEGLHLQKLARGEVRRPLVVAEPPLRFEEAVELEYPVDLLEPLAFLLNRMLEQLCARLAARALATNELKLRLDLEVERTLCLPVPMLDAKVFLKLLQLDLQAHPPQAPVNKIWLRAEPAEPRRAQNGLFVPQEPEAERLELTIARINKEVGTSCEENPHPISPNPGEIRVGQPRVGSPEILDTHRADGFRVKPFAASGQWPVASGQHAGEGARATPAPIAALRVFRPPLAAVVTVRDGRPAHLASPERPTMRGEVVWCAGPWRSSGEWWTEGVWSRAEWDVAVRNEEGVALYRIYHDEMKSKWFVEGSYD